MKVTTKDIAVGKIFYTVTAVGKKYAHKAKVGNKIIATSGVYTCPIIDSLKFNCIEIFDTWVKKDSHQYCSDRGMVEDKPIYNLNRIFHTKEEAEDFVKQCHSGVFKDPIDQKFYDGDNESIIDHDFWWFS